MIYTHSQRSRRTRGPMTLLHGVVAQLPPQRWAGNTRCIIIINGVWCKNHILARNHLPDQPGRRLGGAGAKGDPQDEQTLRRQRGVYPFRLTRPALRMGLNWALLQGGLRQEADDGLVAATQVLWPFRKSDVAALITRSVPGLPPATAAWQPANVLGCPRGIEEALK